MIPDVPPPILDYANLRSASRLRLPVTSKLVWTKLPNGFEIIETSSGKIGATIALVFGFSTMALLGCLSVFLFGRPGRFGGLICTSPVIICQIILMALVINNTWRKTRVLARPGWFELVATSLFRRKHYAWPAADIRAICVREHLTGAGYVAQALMVFVFSNGQEVRLFTDHPPKLLQILLDALLAELGMPALHPPTPALPIPATPLTPRA